MNKVKQFLTEHALVFVIAAISLVSLILIIIVFTLVSSGNTRRKISIQEISGNAFILKNDGQVPADKNTVLESGDVLITSAASTLKLRADKDKYIYIEPETTLYVYYTDSADKGSIVVNISEGAAICRIDSKIHKNSAFEVRTPNAVVSAEGTVFRTQFRYLDTYGGHDAVKLTEVECAQGAVDIQLYDNDAAPADQLMLLTEGKSARLMSCADVTRYEYLNSDTDLYSLSEDALKTFIRIAAERQLSYSLSTLNTVYQNRLTGNDAPQVIETMYAPAPQTEAVSEAPAVTTVTAPSEINSDTVITVSASETPDSVPETTTEAATASTGSTALSIAETTTKVFTIQQTETTTEPTETQPPVATIPPISAETLPEYSFPMETSSDIPPIQTAAPVTAPPVTPPAATQLPPPTATTSPTVPWWEIINSAALTSDQ